MRHVDMTVRAAEVDPAKAFARISDFARYPELTETVLAVDLDPAAGQESGDGSVVSTWLVAFRKGQLRWVERDVLDPVARHIEFTQLEGDFASFSGSWQVDAHEAGALVRFTAAFDLGIPSLAQILDPVAEATLRSNILAILAGLLGQVDEVESERVHVHA